VKASKRETQFAIKDYKNGRSGGDSDVFYREKSEIIEWPQKGSGPTKGEASL